MNVTVITDYPLPFMKVVEEYTDFKEIRDKYPNILTEFEFPTGEEALTVIIKNKLGFKPKLGWRTNDMIGKIAEPVIYGGHNLQSYFTWNNNLFMQMMGFYAFIGEME